MKAIRAGKKRQRVTVQLLTGATRDSFGQTVQNWVDQGTYWAEVVPMRTRDIVVSEQVKSQVMHVVRFRYLGASISIGPTTHRLNLKGRTLGIVGYVNVEERNREYELTCQEIEV